MDDLVKMGIINEVDLILGEGHKFCDDDVGLKLENCGFKLYQKG